MRWMTSGAAGGSRASRPAFLVLCGVLASGVALMALMPQAKADELSDLQGRIEALSEQVAALRAEQNQAAQKEAAARKKLEAKVAAATVDRDQIVTAGDMPGSFKIPGTGTSILIGGYVKLDALYHVKGFGNQDQLDATTTPLDGSAAAGKRGNTKIHAKQTRLDFATSTPTAEGPLKTLVEVDFEGGGGNAQTSNSYNPRLRKAYAEFDGFLVGQTDSTFRDPEAEAETLDFGEDTGLNQTRQAQIRYTYRLKNGLSAAIAIENPETDYSNAAGAKFNTSTSGTLAFNHLPDLVGALRLDGGFGHFMLRGVVRQLSLDNGAGIDQRAGAYGIGASGRWNLFGKDNLRGEINWGDGIGRYIVDAGGEAAAVTAAGELKTEKALGLSFSYQHWWLANLRSNLSFGYTHIDTLGSVYDGCATADCPNRNLLTTHVNLIWSPVRNVDTGIEYIHARREVANGTRGSEDTIQASAIYHF